MKPIFYCCPFLAILLSLPLLAQNAKIAEEEAIRKAIEGETKAIQLCDYNLWAEHWWHEDYCYFSLTTPHEHLGLRGWAEISKWGKKATFNCSPVYQEVQKSKYRFSINGNMAFVNFVENGINENSRVLEKRGGKWKLVRMGFISNAEYNIQKDTLTIEKIAPNIWMLSHYSAGNIGVLATPNGFILVDNQFSAWTNKVRNALSRIAKMPVKYIINTHWHDDHSQGNENFARSGSIIVAHENSRQRLTKDQFIELFNLNIAARSWDGLPSVTFTRDISFHEPDETVYVYHAPNAHTDGDAIIHFKTSNVIHTGDVFMTIGLPFIDEQHGGSLNGIIAAVETILKICDDQTKIIPGHGGLASKKDLLANLDMLKVIQGKVQNAITQGLTLEQILASKPAEGYNSFYPADEFVKIVYRGLQPK